MTSQGTYLGPGPLGPKSSVFACPLVQARLRILRLPYDAPRFAAWPFCPPPARRITAIRRQEPHHFHSIQCSVQLNVLAALELHGPERRRSGRQGVGRLAKLYDILAGNNAAYGRSLFEVPGGASRKGYRMQRFTTNPIRYSKGVLYGFVGPVGSLTRRATRTGGTVDTSLPIAGRQLFTVHDGTPTLHGVMAGARATPLGPG